MSDSNLCIFKLHKVSSLASDIEKEINSHNLHNNFSISISDVMEELNSRRLSNEIKQLSNLRNNLNNEQAGKRN